MGFKSANLEGQKIAHIEPLSREMVSFMKEELSKDHVQLRIDFIKPCTFCTLSIEQSLSALLQELIYIEVRDQ
jgi:hypothetical protein